MCILPFYSIVFYFTDVVQLCPKRQSTHRLTATICPNPCLDPRCRHSVAAVQCHGVRSPNLNGLQVKQALIKARCYLLVAHGHTVCLKFWIWQLISRVVLFGVKQSQHLNKICCWKLGNPNVNKIFGIKLIGSERHSRHISNLIRSMQIHFFRMKVYSSLSLFISWYR